MAVLGDRATNVLDMIIEGYRRSGQTMEQPNMSQVAPTPLQQAMNRPVSRLTSTGDVSTIMPDGGGVAQTSVPLMQDLARGRVLNPINPMQDMGQPMIVGDALRQEAVSEALNRPDLGALVRARYENQEPRQATIDPNRLIQGREMQPGQGPMQPGVDRETALRQAKVAKDVLETGDESFISQVQGFFGGRENMLRLAMAFNTMRLQPDQGLQAALSKQLENVGVSSRAQQIAQALRAKGTPAALSAADYIERTGDYKGGYKMFRESGKVVQISGADLNKREGTTAYDEDAVYNVNTITGQKSAIGGGGVSVNLGPQEGSLSTDYTFLRDSEGNPVMKNGLPVAVPVPGSPAAKEAQETVEKGIGRQVQRERAGGTVIQDIQRGLDLIPELSGLEGMSGIAGANARKLAEGIEGTVTNRISKFKESALSNVGLDTLQQMRENSPTGGALGQVPIQQQKRLEQVLGSLDVTQELDVLEQNMQRVINIYLDIVYGAEAERELLMQKGELSAEENNEINSFYYDLPFDPLGRPIVKEISKPDDIPQNVWDVMTDDEKKAF